MGLHHDKNGDGISRRKIYIQNRGGGVNNDEYSNVAFNLSGYTLVAVLLCALIAVPLAYNATIVGTDTKTETIYPQTKYETDYSMNSGETRTVYGESGEKKITYKVRTRFWTGEEVSREKTKEETAKKATNTIIYSGTYHYYFNDDDDEEEEDVDDYYYDDRGGAICKDGTRSYSTGRGTCSHHQGVKYWL